MEFHEKLQELRKNKGMTQEELAEALFVSRTAISKWESGRGYPSIDSLKEISNFFSVSIDELLSGEKILSIAERESKSKIRSMCDLIFGIVDLFSFLLIILPLYPNTVGEYIYSVNLIMYTEIAPFQKMIYWIMYSALIVIGIVKIVLRKLQKEKYNKRMTRVSMLLSVITVLVLAITREAYAIIVIFVLLVIKVISIFKSEQGVSDIKAE